MFDMLRRELRMVMRQAGTPSIAAITKAQCHRPVGRRFLSSTTTTTISAEPAESAEKNTPRVPRVLRCTSSLEAEPHAERRRGLLAMAAAQRREDEDVRQPQAGCHAVAATLVLKIELRPELDQAGIQS